MMNIHYVTIITLLFYTIVGMSVLVSGSVNLESTMIAAYNAVIPVFHNFMVSNAVRKVICSSTSVI